MIAAPTLLPLFVAIPLGAAFIAPLASLLHRRAAYLLALLATAALTLLAAGQFGQPDVSYAVGGWEPPFGINLYADSLTRLLHVLIAGISFLVVIYAGPYLKRYTGSVRFFTLLLLMIAGMNGVTATGDLFNLFVFLEIAAISSYALVAFGIEREELEASFKYLVLGGIGSAFILIGIALNYNLTGTLNLADIAQSLMNHTHTAPVRLVAALFIMGFGLKAAMAPFHAWLPDAHSSAPAPISAMLSGLLIKALGIYCLLRVIYLVFGAEVSYLAIFRWLGLISMTIGALLAIGQDDLKRMLAYSSISQMGFILFAAGLGTALGLAGALLHLVNHAVFKSLLFLCVGAVEQETGSRSLHKLGGLWKKMPVTAAACAAGSFSISGIPPFGGFFSKVVILIATVQAADSLGVSAYWYAGVLVAVSFVTLAYFARLQTGAFFGGTTETTDRAGEAPLPMAAAVMILAVITLGLGLATPWILHMLIEPAGTALLDTGSYIQRVLGML